MAAEKLIYDGQVYVLAFGKKEDDWVLIEGRW